MMLSVSIELIILEGSRAMLVWKKNGTPTKVVESEKLHDLSSRDLDLVAAILGVEEDLDSSLLEQVQQHINSYLLSHMMRSFF